MNNWEAQYQSGETPWDKGAPAPELVVSIAEGRLNGRVLVPGCGHGHDVRAIAASGVDEVVGLDLAPSAIEGARSKGTPKAVRFVVGDFFKLPDDLQGTFDCVWEHTCFCAIPIADRPRYVRSAWRALRPGGRLLAIFYLDPGWDNPNEGPPFGVTKGELDEFFSECFELEQEWSPRGAFPGREGREWVRQLRRKT